MFFSAAENSQTFLQNLQNFPILFAAEHGLENMEFLFQSRGAGKRQVKPSQDIALLEDQLGAESSDDSEYKVESDRDRDDSNDSQGDDESSDDSNDDSNDDDDQDDNEEELSTHSTLFADYLILLYKLLMQNLIEILLKHWGVFQRHRRQITKF